MEGAEEGGKKKSWVARKKAEWRRVAGSAVVGEKKKGVGWRAGGAKYTKTCGTHILQVSIESKLLKSQNTTLFHKSPCIFSTGIALPVIIG